MMQSRQIQIARTVSSQTPIRAGPDPKAMMIAIALVVAAGVFFLLSFDTKSLWWRKDLTYLWMLLHALTGLAAAIGYVLLGAVTAKLCAALRSWAYAHDPEESIADENWAVIMGSFWPITLPVCLILYVFLGLIHRLF